MHNLEPFSRMMACLSALQKMRVKQFSKLKETDLVLAQKPFECFITNNYTLVTLTLQVVALDVFPDNLHGLGAAGLRGAHKLLQGGGDVEGATEARTTGGFRFWGGSRRGGRGSGSSDGPKHRAMAMAKGNGRGRGEERGWEGGADMEGRGEGEGRHGRACEGLAMADKLCTAQDDEDADDENDEDDAL